MVDSAGSLLIVDDDTVVRQSLSVYLEDSGFHVHQASDGSKALALVQEITPDLVICDLRMPRVDGLQVLDALAKQHADIPVIVVSGAGVMSDVVEALRLGAVDYFIKPVADLEVLELSVKRALEQSQLRHLTQQYRADLERANAEMKAHLSELEQDQQAGRYVQMKMLPETPKQVAGYELSHCIIPSLYLSGDFVEYVTVGDRHLTFFIADVSGHGASSAFVTVLLKNLAARKRSDFAHKGDRTLLCPVSLLKTANREMLDLDLGKHITMFVAVLDMETNQLKYSVAGHLPLPILSDGKQARYLEGSGRPVGLFPDSDYSLHHVELPSSFSLTLFSDGVLEILPAQTLQQKEDYLLSLYQQGMPDLASSIERLRLEGVKDAPDDIAVMTVRRVAVDE